MTRKLVLLLGLLLLAPGPGRPCSKGCLSCDTETQKCRVCDSLNMYFLSASSCNKSAVSNCYLVDSRGRCVQCITGYYFDAERDDCLEVPRAYLLQNCVTYSRFNFCSKCNADSYLTASGNCLPVPVRIEHCNEYQPDDPAVCLQCFAGHVLTFDGSACTPLATLAPSAVDENCGSYSRFQCQACQAPFVRSKAFYSEYQPLLHDADFSAFLWHSHFSFSDRQFVFRTCELPDATGCARVDPYLMECAECSDGFFFSERTRFCEANPQGQIQNCVVYSSASVCAECASGFHPTSGRAACEANVPIDECLVYDGASEGSTRCQECNPTHKLTTSTPFCTIRTTPTIDGCEKLAISTETCATCLAGNIPTSDSAKCLPALPGCSVYANSTSASTAHVCSECEAGLVYSTANNLCEAPSGDVFVENCAKYQNDNGGCSTCNNHFYLQGGVCKPHRFIPDCDQYSGTQAHSCSACHLGFVRMSLSNQCHQGTRIPNCLVNLTDSACSVCALGYYGPLCAEIPASQNCLQLDPSDDSVCLRCVDGFYLQGGSCSAARDFELRYCQELGTHSCSKCRDFSVLVGVEEFSICRPRSQDANVPPLCARFDEAQSKCTQCLPGFFLDANSCVKACPAARSSLVLRQYSESNGVLVLSAVNKCVDGSSESNALCEVFVPDSRDPTKLVCAKCKSGSVPGVNLSTASHHMFVLANSAVSEDVPVDHSLDSPGLQCLSDSNLDLVQNCDLWSDLSGQKRCVKCRYGYKGALTHNAGDSYIEKCIKDFECSRTKAHYSAGLGQHPFFQNLYPKSVPSALLSCHFCADASEIPFLYATNSAAGMGLTNYDPAGTPTLESTATTTDDFAHQCHNPFTFKFYNGPSSSISGFPSMCALGLVDPSQTISTNGRSTFLQCLACQRGYKATFTGNYISGCSLISNCEKSWEFGECSLCAPGFVWEYDTTKGQIDKTSCVSFKDRQCVSGFEQSAHQHCKICKPGFSPNSDGICEKFMPSFCSDGFVANSPQPGLSSEVGALRDLLAFTPLGLGCQSCASPGQTLRKVSQKTMLCVPSYLAQWNQFPAATLLIPNCRQYAYPLTDTLANDFAPFQAAPQCAKCAPGFLETVDGRSCHPVSGSLSHCLLVNSSNGQCTRCADHYFVLSGQCQPNSLEFCEIAAYSTSSSSVVCSKCDAGYYFDSGQSSVGCIPGRLPNCKYYNGSDPEDCVLCDEGFQAVPVLNSKKQCLRLEGTRCQSIATTATEMASNLFKCTQCDPGFYPGVFDEAKLDSRSDACLSLSPVSGCTAVNSGNLSVSDFRCSACEEATHFLSGSPPFCHLRTAISNCSTYHATLDECATCASGFYLSVDKRSCEANPVGVQFCEMHEPSGTICKFCDSDHSLFGAGDICTALTPAEKQANCRAYDQSKRCIRCEAGHLLVNFACQATSAQNCETFASPSACATCGNMFLLNPDSAANPRSCLPVSIPDCLENALDKCSLCDAGKKLSVDGSSCSSVGSPTPNCFSYDSNEKCVRCETPFILNPETGKCLIEESMERFLDPNCAHFSLSPECNTCRAGYFFDADGKCESCEIEGCHFCARGGARCNLCLTGYFMDQKGECVQNADVDFDSFDVLEDLAGSARLWKGLLGVWASMLALGVSCFSRY